MAKASSRSTRGYRPDGSLGLRPLTELRVTPLAPLFESLTVVSISKSWRHRPRVNMCGGGNVIAPVKCDLHPAASGPVPCPPAKMGPFDANRNRAGCSRHISEKPQSPQPAQAVAVFFARGRLRRAYGPSLMGKRYPLPAPASPTFAEGSARIARGSTSPPCWPVRGSASRRSTTAFGSPASCTTISATSTSSKKPGNPSTTRSARGWHPCLR